MATSHSKAAILRLPEELLVHITEDVDITDLHVLSITCRRIRPIAQEGLVRRATLPLKNVWKLVDLLQAYSTLVISFTHLRLGPISEDAARSIVSNHNAAQRPHMIHGDYSICDTAFKESRCTSAGMKVLLTLAHGLKCVSMGTVSSHSFDLLNACILTGTDTYSTEVAMHSYEKARSDLQARLEEVNVDPDHPDAFPATSLVMSLHLSECSKLKRLVIPYRTLFKRPGDRLLSEFTPCRLVEHRYYTEPHRILPPSLESVHIIFGTVSPDVRWLDRLILNEVGFPKLREVQLLFKQNLLSAAWNLCCYPDSRLLATLRGWQASRVDLTTRFGIARFTDVAIMETKRDTPAPYIAGDIIPAVEKCLATTLDQLKDEPEMLAALGYVAGST